jgi:hypothetical protein
MNTDPREEKFGFPINRNNPGWKWNLGIWLVIVRPYRIVYGWIFYTILKKHNAYLIARETKRYRGDICLDHNFEPVKLLGWTDVPDDDYYWVLQPMRARGVGNQKFYLSSCVGSPYWIKWNMNPWYYRQIENIFYLNSEPEEDVLKDLQSRKLVLQ